MTQITVQSVKKSEATVDTCCSAYTSMKANWPKINALMSGSWAWRLLREAVLPKAEAEKDDSYNVRLRSGYLYGSYKKTVEKIAGKPFSKNITIPNTINKIDQIARMRDDIDGCGTAIEEFAKALLKMGVNRGVTHILTEYPVTINEDGSTPNAKQERDAGFKPYLVHVPPENLISWSFCDDGGLDEIRFKENSVEKDGRWGEKVVNRIRVINRTGYEKWKKDDGKGEYVLEEEGTHTFGKVPLTTLYLNKTGEMTGETCLGMLAEAEEDFFSSYSDQKYGLHYGRFPFLAGTGLTEKEAEEGIVLSAKTFLRSTKAEANYQWVTHDGKIFEVGFKDLDRTVARMEALGLEPLVEKSGNVTATSKAIDQSNHESDMQSWVRLLENAIESAYQLAAEIIGVELPDDFKIDIFNEFSISTKSAQFTDYLLKSCQGRLISKETYWAALKRFGILPENFDAVDEKERLEKEGPDLGVLGLSDNDEGDEE